jgi:NitT/TauT family transport system substrate-binding protein
MKTTSTTLALAAVMLLGAAAGASADDKIKLAIGQRGNWDTSVSEVGQRAGIFKKHGLELDIVYTNGAGETQQAVISGSVDLGIAAGVMGVMSAYSKGAPVRIISAETTGANDLYWYVKADSPIKSLKDTADKTLAYSTNGSSTHGIVTAFMKQYDLKAKPTAVGGPAANLTAAAAFKGQTVRLNIANANFLKDHKAVVDRYMKAYRETVDFMYNDPKALKIYSEWLNITEAKAKRTRDDFFPRSSVEPDKITGLDTIVKDAVALKFTANELTKAQLDDLIQIPPR